MNLHPLHGANPAWRRLASATLLASLVACGGGGGGGGQGVTAPPPPPPPVQGPAGTPKSQQVAQARAEVLADTCFSQQDVSLCKWQTGTHAPADFAMANNSGEAVLIIDDIPEAPLAAIRYKNRIKGFYRYGAGGALSAASMQWRVPATLWSVLSRFASAEHVSAASLAELSAPLQQMYGKTDIFRISHGAMVFQLLADENPHQALVLLDGFDLALMAPEDYCDAGGSAAARDRLLQTARRAADELGRIVRDNNVRFVNLSYGHTLDSVTAGWQARCRSPLPSTDVLREKLSAHGAMYATLFNTPGVLVAQAAIQASGPAEFPYDVPSAAYPNRLRVGYFATLDSGLDASGRGNYRALNGWPAAANADLFVNTGVLTQRPFPANATPQLQTDAFGTALAPVGAATTSWVTPLALSYLVHIRNAEFGARAMDNQLIAEIFARAAPALCPDLPGGRCLYQDPALHGKLESVRLAYRPLRLQ